MNSKERGLVIIVNNERFVRQGMSNRAGTSRDRQVLDHLFRELHFKPAIIQDKKAEVWFVKIFSLSKSIYSN